MLVQDLNGESPTAEDAGSWKEALELSYPVLADADGEFFASYGSGQDVFVFYVIDRDGLIAWRATREDADTLETIRSEVEGLLDY